MLNQTLQLYKKRYVVRSKTTDSAVSTKNLLAELSQLRDAVSRKWSGTQNAVNEIREQRGGTL